jgi:hypothetical protein
VEAQALRETADERDRLARTDAAQALRVADLLERALDYHAHEGDGDCPVCGGRDALDAEWRANAKVEARQLSEVANTVVAARNHLGRLVAEARGTINPPPAELARCAEVGVEGGAAAEGWAAWHQGTALEDPRALADHLESSLPALTRALADLRSGNWGGARTPRGDMAPHRARPAGLAGLSPAGA